LAGDSSFTLKVSWSLAPFADLNMIGVHTACVLKILVFCNPSIHYACVFHMTCVDNLNMIGVHPACVLKMLVFCNPSIHYACI
jgi:hypothetical protein